MWGDTVSGGNDLLGDVNFGSGPGANAVSYGPRFAATPGTPFHAAMAWDIDGIDGSSDTIRVFRDGVLITKTSSKWNPSGDPRPDFVLSNNPDGEGYDKYVIDNLVLYDYAKTDFSDRFNEDPRGGLASLAVVNLKYSLGTNPDEAEGTAIASSSGGSRLKGAQIWMHGRLNLDPLSDGINPPAETVAVSLGSWSVTIPAGSFVKRGDCFDFEGPVDGQKVFLKFRETAPNSYQVILKVKRANVTELTDPVTVRVRSGGDGGSVSVDLRGLLTGSAAAD
jgi:hypothetical protein